MTDDPMLHERCDDHPEVCRLDRLQGCMYTRGEEEQCAEQTVSSVVPRSVPRSVQISLQRMPRHCPHLLLLGPNTPNNTQSPGAVAHSFEFATRQLIQTLIPQARTLCTLKLQLNTFCTNTPKVQEFCTNTPKVRVQVENEMKFKTYSLGISVT